MNLDNEARAATTIVRGASSPYLVPAAAQELVEAAESSTDSDHTFGGYLEDRGALWSGSYLEADDRFIHLGIDLNAPAGTPVAAPIHIKILAVDDDTPEESGWGPRIVAQILEGRLKGCGLVLGHLSDVCVAPGELVVAGQLLAEIGAPPLNGGWFSHLHVQVISKDLLLELGAQSPDETGRRYILDGYGRRADLKELRRQYPDPWLLLAGS